MRKVKYPFVIYPAVEGGYIAEIPALKGCLAQGETLSEIIEELETMEKLWLETATQTGLKLPKIKAEVERVKQKLAA